MCVVLRGACGDVGGEAAWGTSDPLHSTRGSHSPLRPSFLHTVAPSYRIPTHLFPLPSLTLIQSDTPYCNHIFSLLHHLSPTYIAFPSLYIFHSPLTFHFTQLSSLLSTFCHSCLTSHNQKCVPRSLPSRTPSSVCLYELSRTNLLASYILPYIYY